MRCCACGGELTVTEQTVVGAHDEIDDDDGEYGEWDAFGESDAMPAVRLLTFAPVGRDAREARRGH